MKKGILWVLPIVIIVAVSCAACGDKPPYPLKDGLYGFERAFITDLRTKEATEKDFDDILNNKEDYALWGCLLGFQVGIDENTEYFRKKNNVCFVLNEGLAFEVAAENTLRLHFTDWNGSDLNRYDIVIILGWQKTYLL